MTGSWTYEHRKVRTVIDDWKNERFCLPHYQRDTWEWSLDHMSTLIDSLIGKKAFPLLPMVLNKVKIGDESPKVVEHIVEGRHRIQTAYLFYTNEFEWCSNGTKLHYRDLPQKEKTQFLEATYTFYVLDNWNDQDAMIYFSRLNAGQQLRTEQKLNALDCATLNYVRHLDCVPQFANALVNVGVINASRRQTEIVDIVARLGAMVVVDGGLSFLGNVTLLVKKLLEVSQIGELKKKVIRVVMVGFSQAFAKQCLTIANRAELFSILYHMKNIALDPEYNKELETFHWPNYASFYKGWFVKQKNNKKDGIQEYYKTLSGHPNSVANYTKRSGILNYKYMLFYKKTHTMNPLPKSSTKQQQVAKNASFPVVPKGHCVSLRGTIYSDEEKIPKTKKRQLNLNDDLSSTDEETVANPFFKSETSSLHISGPQKRIKKK